MTYILVLDNGKLSPFIECLSQLLSRCKIRGALTVFVSFVWWGGVFLELLMLPIMLDCGSRGIIVLDNYLINVL